MTSLKRIQESGNKMWKWNPIDFRFLEQSLCAI